MLQRAGYSLLSHTTILLLGVPVSLEEFENDVEFIVVMETFKLASSETMLSPSICVNFTHTTAMVCFLHVNTTGKIGVTNQCFQAPLRYSFHCPRFIWTNTT